MTDKRTPSDDANPMLRKLRRGGPAGTTPNRAAALSEMRTPAATRCGLVRRMPARRRPEQGVAGGGQLRRVALPRATITAVGLDHHFSDD
jgi:hypothetical protein